MAWPTAAVSIALSLLSVASAGAPPPQGVPDLSNVLQTIRAGFPCSPQRGGAEGEHPAPAAQTYVARSDHFADRPTDWPWVRWLHILEACDHSTGSFPDIAALAEYDRDHEPLVSMSRQETCVGHLAAGAAVASGVAVEFGTWAGASMRCMAAGLNATGRAGAAFGFDAFVNGLYPSNTRKLRQSAKWWAEATRDGRNPRRFDLEPLFRWQVEDVYPSVQAVRCNFNEASCARSHLPKALPVDAFATDAAKSDAALARHLSNVAPMLRPGSVVVLADFFTLSGGKTAYTVRAQRFWVTAKLLDGAFEALGWAGSDLYLGQTVLLSPAVLAKLHGAAWRRTRAGTSARCASARNYWAAIQRVCGAQPSEGCLPPYFADDARRWYAPLTGETCPGLDPAVVRIAASGAAESAGQAA